MAVSSSWFENWEPPADIFPDVPPNSSFNHAGSKASKPTTAMADFLPFFLSLSFLDPKPPTHHHYQRQEHPSPPKQRLRQPKPLERTGPFNTWYHWNQLDFAFPSKYYRTRAIDLGEYVPENNLPLGIEVYKDRLFVTMPKWKPGVPATLAVLPRVPKEPSPLLAPYPNWDWHTTDACWTLTSVFRIQADNCGRLWVLDSGQIDVTIKPRQICPPQVFIFDLQTDELLVRYELPEEFIKQDSLYSNIIVDIRDGDCRDVHAYLSDVWRYGLVVFSLKHMRSWRITDHLFYPDPLAASYDIHGVKFEWMDGIFSLALGPLDAHTNDRLLYFHPMSSFRECYVKTSVICNETGWEVSKDSFKVIGQSRGERGHASASGMDRNGILFYNLVSKDSIGCWDSRKPYTRVNHGLVVRNSTTLVFPNDLKLDNEPRQSVWIITNRLPFYLYKSLDKRDVNFRIMSAYTDEAIRNTICEPGRQYPHSYDHVDNRDCN